MTNQNNAAQAANKEIREAFELSYAMDADDPASATELSHFTNGWRACIMSQVGKPVVMKLAVDATAAIDLINATRRGLRAPVADERAAFDLLDTLFTAYENGTPCYEEPDSQGGYLGMALRIDDDTFRSCADLLNKHRPRAAAALASAPVAGEAFMYGIMGPDGKAHFEEFCVSGDRTELQTEVVDHLNRHNPEDGAYSVVALFRGAASQASAEVLDAVQVVLKAFKADEAQGYHTRDRQFAISILEDALKQPQAPVVDESANLQGSPVDKSGDLQVGNDGGQQRAAFDHPVFAFLLGEGQLHGVDFGERAPGAVGKWWWRKDLRAALSAAQPEQGERDGRD